MINQEIIDFITAQLKKGIEKDTIFKELMAHGWTFKDVQEGFDFVTAPKPKHFFNRSRILVVIFIFLFLAILMFFLDKHS